MLGEMLLNDGLITKDRLHQALGIQRRLCERLGSVLTHEGWLSHRELHAALARQHQLSYVDLLENPPSAKLVDKKRVNDYIEHQFIPWREEKGWLHVACVDPKESCRQFIEQLYGERVQIVMTSPRDLVRSIERLCNSELDRHARDHLLRMAPWRSASLTRKRENAALVLAVLALLIAWSVTAPHILLPLVVGACNLLYVCTLGFKLLLCFAGMKQTPHPTHEEMLALPEDAGLPVYTVLVPLYREVESVTRLIEALSAFDYPKSRLDIKLIVEAEDFRTISAIKAARPPACFEIIHVPYSLPKTKPKACNYALAFARGEFVTIYDAEDHPEPSQLKKAVACFRASDASVACLQAELNYYNRGENILTSLFAIEYATLFRFMLPGLYRLRMPIPLGGTSNHIRRECLQKLGEWDPYNVTEDADLGIRLAAHGYRTLPLRSLTGEEAPIKLSMWIKQRSRWVKGYIQTWAVAMRQPYQLYKAFGLTGFIGFQLFVGAASLVYLVSPVVWGLTAVWAWQMAGHPAPIPSWVLASAASVFIIGLLIQWGLALLVVRRMGWRRMLSAVATYPFYWFLHSFASLRAIWQLCVNPFHWEKTDHGISSMIPGKA